VFVRWALRERSSRCASSGGSGVRFAEAGGSPFPPRRRRVDPPCEVFGECGGCRLQHADYPYQLEMKLGDPAGGFRRIGKTDVAPEIAPPAGAVGYRHRGRFRVDGEAVGFHALAVPPPGAGIPLPVMIDAINAVLPGLRGLDRFAKVSEVQVASDGVRVSASFPGSRRSRDGRAPLRTDRGGPVGRAIRGFVVGEERITLRWTGFRTPSRPEGSSRRTGG